jgi:hypothetical protein
MAPVKPDRVDGVDDEKLSTVVDQAGADEHNMAAQSIELIGKRRRDFHVLDGGFDCIQPGE